MKEPDHHEAKADYVHLVLADPIRVMIVSLLRAQELSADELSARIEIPADRIRAHLRRLRQAGVIAASREEARRGVVQRFYVTGESLTFDEEECDALTTKQMRNLGAGILRLSFAEAARSFIREPRNRPDSRLIRNHLRLSESGWRELVEIHREAFEKVEALKASESKRHSEGAAHAPIEATSVLICFEQADPLS